MQPFHFYAKKRIIVEKQFIPLKDLFKFKIYVINRDIKFIDLEYYLNSTIKIYLIYVANYNFKFKNYIYKVS